MRFCTIFRNCSVLLLGMVLFQFCEEPEDYPKEPKVSFENFKQNGDSTALLTVSFTDGDGNIGLDKGDTTGKYSSDSKYHYNLFLEYYEKQNGEWVHRKLQPPFYYRIPPLEPEGKSKALEGEVEVTLEPLYFDPVSPYDTIKYSIQLVDRDLNESNVVETDPIITP